LPQRNADILAAVIQSALKQICLFAAQQFYSTALQSKFFQKNGFILLSVLFTYDERRE
jgi:hypothetical protein